MSVLVMMFWLNGQWVEFYLPPITREQCLAIITARHKSGAYKKDETLMYCTPVWKLKSHDLP